LPTGRPGTRQPHPLPVVRAVSGAGRRPRRGLPVAHVADRRHRRGHRRFATARDLLPIRPTHLRPDHYRLEPSRRFGSWVVDPTTRLIGQERWHESARPFPYPDTKAHHITVRPRPTEPLPGSGRLAWEPGLHRGLMTAAWGRNVRQFLDDSPSPLVGLDSVSGYQVDAGPGLETAELREFW